ncbi:unknown protein [Desulfotalea psychrophila LSv54]|uniref:Uncharacterized protein n=1 Tax=Desulfotalea psychrophila (strain LSv54 / DSM 12343) TaxID=177439 RepID=Q6AMA8_DESPS|nr:unknown protein [Desulfotalea psychrophila LSv54]
MTQQQHLLDEILLTSLLRLLSCPRTNYPPIVFKFAFRVNPKINFDDKTVPLFIKRTCASTQGVTSPPKERIELSSK